MFWQAEVPENGLFKILLISPLLQPAVDFDENETHCTVPLYTYILYVGILDFVSSLQIEMHFYIM